MGVDRLDEVGIRVYEGQTARVYGTGFTVGSLAGVGAMARIGGLGLRFVLLSI